MTYKIKDGLVAIPRDCFAPPAMLTWHDHNQKIGITQSTHNTPEKSFVFFRQTPLDWNALSQDIVDAPPLEAFKQL